jgi:hypothetical protein
MIAPSEAMIAGLRDRCLDWWIGNVRELEVPVMIVRDYSPSYDLPPLSIAFDLAGGPKCWLSTSQVRPIDGNAPSPHEPYRSFAHSKTTFYPYSIRSLELTIFNDIDEFHRACWILYQHAVLGDE